MRWAGRRRLLAAVTAGVQASPHAGQHLTRPAVRPPLAAYVRCHLSTASTASPSPSNATASTPSSSTPPSPSRSFLLFDYTSDLSPSPSPLLSPLFHFRSPPPTSVRIVEVGPRDGLQNEPSHSLTFSDKVQLIDRLSACHLRTIEAGSFVSPAWVPSMASSDVVLRSIQRRMGTSYAALTPNLKGLQRAIDARADEVAVFASASEAFSRANLNCSIADSLSRFAPVMEAARSAGLPVRGYVSCVVGCPYEGWIDPAAVLEVTRALLDAGCYEVSLGDTIGVGTPGRVASLLTRLGQGGVGVDRLAVHFHDTYGQALGNVLASVMQGVGVVDASVAGLGGCPYAVGATGNVATEDVVFMLHGSGVDTGVELRKLVETGWWISEKLGREVQSRAGKALGMRINKQGR